MDGTTDLSGRCDRDPFRSVTHSVCPISPLFFFNRWELAGYDDRMGRFLDTAEMGRHRKSGRKLKKGNRKKKKKRMEKRRSMISTGILRHAANTEDNTTTAFPSTAGAVGIDPSRDKTPLSKWGLSVIPLTFYPSSPQFKRRFAERTSR